MKKLSLFLIITIMLVASILPLSACNLDPSNRIDSDGIKEVVIHIRSNESSKALEKCKFFNQKTFEAGKLDILAAINEKLNYCITHTSYESDTYWINEDTIEELKIFKDILSLLPLEDVFTNAPDFVNAAIELEKFIKWNEYAAEEDNYLKNIQNYMDTGASYRNTSWNIAVTYYEKALAVCRSAATAFSNTDNYGFKETADFYKAYGTLIYNVIHDKDNTLAEENNFEKAKAEYLRITQEYIDALEEYIEILEAFPTNIY